MVHYIVLSGQLQCVLWFIALCFVVHFNVLCSSLHCALWPITLCFVVHCIVLCGFLKCALWSMALCFVVVTSHCVLYYGRSALDKVTQRLFSILGS